WIFTITDHIVPPLNCCGDWVINCQISANFSFHVLRAFSKFCTTQLSLKSIPPFGQNQGQAATGLPPNCHIESARDKGQNFFCECDDDATGQGEKTVGALAWVMAFQRKADL